MFAVIAAVLFGFDVLLRLIAHNPKWEDVLLYAGLFCVAMHLVIPAVPWRHQ